MKITFINPNVTDIASLNLGLAYVISSAERFHQVRLLDLTFHQNDYLPYVKNALTQDRPDVIGFSVTTFNFKSSLEIARTIRQAHPGIPFLFGGVHPTLLPEETIQHPLVDALCIGEGETAILEYLQKLEKGEAPDVPGIWYKDAHGVIHKNPLRPFHQDIDSLPFPDFDHWDVENYFSSNIYYSYASLHLLSSRGCPYTCSCCSNEAIQKAVPGHYYRARSPENVIEEIQSHKKKYLSRGLRTLYFADETFGLDQKKLERFCELYQRAGLASELKWVCATRPDVITPHWARLVADAGCIIVYLGIESGDDFIRTLVYKKNISREQIRQAVANLKSCGVETGCYIMIGCPQETRETIQASIRLIDELKPFRVYFSFYQPLPLTKLAKEVDDTMWKKDKGFAKQGNFPRVSTLKLSLNDIRRILWRIRVTQWALFLRKGFTLRGVRFFVDIMKFMLSIEHCRKYALTNPHVRFELEQKTIFEYILQKSISGKGRA